MRTEDEDTTYTNRGFALKTPVPGDYGGEAVVHESSSAEAPHMWLRVEEPNDLNAWARGDKSGGTHEASLHLSLRNAWWLSEQIRALCVNHYHFGEQWTFNDYMESDDDEGYDDE